MTENTEIKPKTKVIGVRMPIDMVEYIEEQAEREHRTFSGQLLYIVSKDQIKGE
ncbi:MAG: hypothetical protein ACPGQQ_02705 [Candidatus Puniceispirillaceae bacterium]